MSKQIVLGCSYHWWRGDILPKLAPLAGFASQIVTDTSILAPLHNLTEASIQSRFNEGAHCYVAFLDDTPVGYGWVGTKVGHIRQGGLVWSLGKLDRVLWDFETLPAFRGRGVYPHLLQAILRAESVSAERFWIGHQGQNTASKRGIVKAGFSLNNITLLTSGGQIVQESQGDPVRALADPMLPAAKAHNENMPEVVRQQLVNQFSHLFQQGE
ncbi:MAG: GNAT family N-acetyltransferase [Ardenticatenaceae bacterium]|nr:GNAT family N-acetyltransferase [Ardenticatenaceae bacterium]